MTPADVAPFVVAMTALICLTAVILLRPIAKRLGSYLEVVSEERRRDLMQKPASDADIGRIANALEQIDRRLAHVEERQEFTDRLLNDRTQRRLPE
jgi:hypothetical protein